MFALVAPAETHAAGFQVVGLQNMAVRLKNPAEESAFLWMGERLGGPAHDPQIVRVDNEGRLSLQFGDPHPFGALLEFSEFSQISVIDTWVHLWFGRARLVNGASLTGDPPPLVLKTSFGTFAASPHSVVDADVSGRRALFVCLAGSAVYAPALSGDTAHIPEGSMLQIRVDGLAEVKPAPQNLRLAMEAYPLLQMRYESLAPNPPRVRWFSPRAGNISHRDRIDILGRVDETQGPVEITADGAPVSTQSAGLFPAQIKLRPGQDSLTLRLKRETATATLTIRIGLDTSPPAIELDPVSETTRLKEILLSGSVNEAAVLFLSGKVIPIRDRKFSKFAPLRPGMNRLQLTAFDRAGNKSDVDIGVFSGRPDGGIAEVAAPENSPNMAEEPPPLPAPHISKSGWGEWGFVLEFDPAPALTLPFAYTYQVYRSYSKEGPFLFLGETAQPSFTDASNFEYGTSLYYRAALRDDSGRESQMSDPVHFSPVRSQLLPPSPITTKMEGGKVKLMWPKDASMEVGGYNVYRMEVGRAVRVASLPGPPFVMDAPDTFTELHFRISAVSAHSIEESEWSDTVVIRK